MTPCDALSITGYLGTQPGRSGMAAAQDLLDSYKDVTEDNDILKRARHMMSMAASMQNFTRGEGKIKTTQDFFTAAEFFAEESNRLYKLIRMFSYIVPMGEDKRVLMQIADHIPRHCGQMQLLIQMPGVSHLLSPTLRFLSHRIDTAERFLWGWGSKNW